MKNFLKISSLFLIISSISSCISLQDFMDRGNKNKTLQPLSYLDKAPKYKVQEFLNGNLEGFAIIQDENGVIKDSFIVKAIGEWEEKRGTIKYSYSFSGGKKDSRTWLITSQDANSYSAIGHDFIAPAMGRQAGNASEVIYNLPYSFNNKEERVDFRDDLYLVDQNSAIILTTMTVGKKKIGKVTLSLKKVPAAKSE